MSAALIRFVIIDAQFKTTTIMISVRSPSVPLLCVALSYAAAFIPLRRLRLGRGTRWPGQRISS